MIELNSVTKRYGSLLAVDDVTFSVKAGEYFALLGPNGAGKTTIVRMLLDFTRPTSGSLSLNRLPSTDAACRRGVGYVAENLRIPPYLSGWQYLQRCAELVGPRPQPMPRTNAGASSGLSAWKAGNIRKRAPIRRVWSSGSGSARPSWGIRSCSFSTSPSPASIPSASGKSVCFWNPLKREGMTIFLNSHFLSEVEKICDTVAIIDRGRLLVKDSIASIVKDGETLEDLFVRLVKGAT